MKGKIKLLSLLMALAMVASMFVACDGGSKEGDGSKDSNEPVELVWWHWGNAPTAGDDAIAALNEKSKEDIGVTIKGNAGRLQTEDCTVHRFDGRHRIHMLLVRELPVHRSERSAC